MNTFKRLRSIGFALALALSVPALAGAQSPKEEFPTPADFTPAYQTVDGVNLHYLKGGQGPLVLLVHGFRQTWYEWHQLVPDLAKTNTVITIDLLGLGQSSVPKSYVGDIGNWNTYPMVARHPSDFRHVIFMEAPLPDKSIYSFPAFTPQGGSLVWHSANTPAI